MTRIEARSEKFDMFMQLDINSELYPLKMGQKFSLALVPTLNPDGTPDTGYYNPVHSLIVAWPGISLDSFIWAYLPI